MTKTAENHTIVGVGGIAHTFIAHIWEYPPPRGEYKESHIFAIFVAVLTTFCVLEILELFCTFL